MTTETKKRLGELDLDTKENPFGGESQSDSGVLGKGLWQEGSSGRPQDTTTGPTTMGCDDQRAEEQGELEAERGRFAELDTRERTLARRGYDKGPKAECAEETRSFCKRPGLDTKENPVGGERHRNSGLTGLWEAGSSGDLRTPGPTTMGCDDRRTEDKV